MTVLLSISDGMDNMMDEMMTELAGGIGVYPADAPLGYLTGGGTPFSVSYADEIEEVAHVAEVTPLVLSFIDTKYADFGDPMGVTLRGIDLTQDAEVDGPTASSNIIEGRTLVEGAGEVILGNPLAAFGRAAGGDHAAVGGEITVPTLWGDPFTLTVVGIFETGSNIYDMYPYTDIDTAREITGVPSGDVNFISVEADSVENVEALKEDIEAIFEGRPVRTFAAMDLVSSFKEMLGTFSSFLWIVSLVAAIAGGVSIFIVMLISVIERTKEFGILKASGWSNRNIISSVVVQSLIVALLGASVGLGTGYAAGLGIDAYLNFDIALITWTLILTIVGFGLAMGVIGGLYPALRAARVSPIESLRSL